MNSCSNSIEVSANAARIELLVYNILDKRQLAASP